MDSDNQTRKSHKSKSKKSSKGTAGSKASKKSGTLHPKSRAAAQLKYTAIRRDNKLSNRHKQQNVVNKLTDIFRWFREAVLQYSDVPFFSVEQHHTIIKEFIARDDAEIADLTAKLRGRAGGTTGRLGYLNTNRARESERYNIVGIEVPNLQSRKVVRGLRMWDGQGAKPNEVTTIKMLNPERPVHDTSMVFSPGVKATTVAASMQAAANTAAAAAASSASSSMKLDEDMTAAVAESPEKPLRSALKKQHGPKNDGTTKRSERMSKKALSRRKGKVKALRGLAPLAA